MDTDILVVGAGPAGLAVAATLKAKGRRPIVIDRATQVGASWRDHYERLHLHTVKSLSALPGLAFPADAASLRAAPGRRRLPRRLCGACRHRASLRRGSDRDRSRRRRRVAHDDAIGQHLPLARGRRHDRRQQRAVAGEDRRRGGVRRHHRAQPRLPQRRAFRGPPRPRRRPRQHRRGDRARSRRARRRRRALGALAGQHRPARGPRPADAEDVARAGAPAPRPRRRAGAPVLRPQRRRPRAATACSARRSRRCASCASTARRR